MPCEETRSMAAEMVELSNSEPVTVEMTPLLRRCRLSMVPLGRFRTYLRRPNHTKSAGAAVVQAH